MAVLKLRVQYPVNPPTTLQTSLRPNGHGVLFELPFGRC
jgi:hypothetical protein